MSAYDRLPVSRFVSSVEDETVSEPIKIVCIEDEPEMVDLMKLILSRKGYQVIGALGGAEGLEIIARENPDLVLLDLMMPDINGWEVYQRMKSDDAMSQIPVIIVTAKTESIGKVIGIYVARVDDFINKPFGPQELVDSVERVLSRQRDQL
jgi:DNA-binding response OmpR family regulator